MSGSYPKPPSARRPFIVTTYVAGPEGRLSSGMPACCPVGAGDREPRCELSIHHERQRKTGPRHPLSVVRCRTHGLCFTLYPPGYAPYRRQPVLRLSPSGEPLAGGGERARGDFEGTLFEAALDARDARAWARESAEGGAVPDRWWGTQGRHLRLAARLVGVGRELSERLQETIAAVLSVGVLALRERSGARGYRAIGQAVCDVLSRLAGGPRRAFSLLVCGHLVGQWGEPLWWDGERQLVERSPFSVGETSDST